MAASEHNQIDSANELAWELNRTDVGRAFGLAENAYQMAEAANYLYGQAQALGNLAQLNHYDGQNDIALNQVMQAISLFERLAPFKTPYLRALHTQATIYRRLGSYAEALTSYLNLLKLAEMLNDLYFQAMALNGIGACHAETGRYEEALDCYRKCLPIFENMGNQLMTAGMHGNASIAFRKLGQHEASLKCVNTGLSIAKEIEDAELEVFLLIAMGETYIEMNKYPQALDTFQTVLTRLQVLPIHTQRYRLDALIQMGKIYMRQGYLNEARSCYYEALVLAETTGERVQMYRCHAQLAELFKRKGDFQNALLHHEHFHKIKESVYDHENTKKLNSLRVQHETDSARKEAEFYRVQKEMVEKLREQDKYYFETMSQMKDDLIHTTSHDLKNPLTSIKTFTYLLRQNLPSNASPLERYIDRIETQVEQMRALITDVLDLATIEARKNRTLQTILLNSFLEHIVADFAEQAQQKHIELNFTPAVSEVYLALDPEWMQRMFQNLISNALKYTPEGGKIDVAIEVNKTHVLICVQDTGIGIPPEELPHIFEKFYRVKDKKSTSTEGTGLGLAIAREIVEQHGGEIHVTSTVGEGSEFQVILPR